MPSAWAAIRDWFYGAPQVNNAVSLADFLRSEAAFLAQKSSVEYCRARAGTNWQKLFKERAFLEAIEHCRWEAMLAVLADMTLLVEGYLRPETVNREPELAAALLKTTIAALRDYKTLPTRPEGAAPYLEALAADLARAQLGAPHGPAEIAKRSGERLFALLPIHPSLRGHDREMVVNSTRFGMVTFWGKMEKAITDRAGLVRDLIG